ncbi:hypothetical protein Y032_0281g1264 [Ancylostoma ceylanicum]|nr:hypothetical protein Y032_0281g1264 [Ancylostoma ceylanicum]
MKKTQTMANQWSDNGTIQLDGIPLQKVDSFVYLGREINMKNDLTTGIARRRKAAWAALDSRDYEPDRRCESTGSHISLYGTPGPMLWYRSMD